MKSIFCAIGLHKLHVTTKYYPNIHAKTVMQYTFHVECTKCGKVIQHEVNNWDGKDFIVDEESLIKT